MPYVEDIFYCGSVVEKEKKFTFRYHGKTRAAKVNPSSEALARSNEKRAIKHLRRLVNANFKPNDYSLTLTYENDKMPTSPAEAEHQLTLFKKRMRRAYKKIGSEFKYISTTEYSRNNRIHHHLIINYIDPAVVARCWTQGNIKISLLERSGQYARLAEYIVKETRRSYKNIEKRFSAKRWEPSRNLVQPKVEREIVKADSWQEVPEALPGYRITDFYTDVNEITGYPYQFVTMLKLEPPITVQDVERRQKLMQESRRKTTVRSRDGQQIEIFSLF